MAGHKRPRGMGDVYSFDADSYGYGEFSDVQSGAETTADTGLVAQFRNEFNQAVTALDAKVLALAQREQLLISLESVAGEDANDYSDWQSEMSKIQTTNSVIESAQQAIAQVSSWYESIKTSVGLAGMRRRLGALFVIPWGLLSVIVGATVAVSAVVTSSGYLVDKLNLRAWNNENIRRSQQGLPPLPDSTKPQSVGGGLFDGVSNLAKWLAIGFASYMILPSVLKALKK